VGKYIYTYIENGQMYDESPSLAELLATRCPYSILRILPNNSNLNSCRYHVSCIISKPSHSIFTCKHSNDDCSRILRIEVTGTDSEAVGHEAARMLWLE